MPTLALAFNYWIHLLATVVWLGGLVTLTLIAWPGLRDLSGDEEGQFETAFLKLERRFRPAGNVSLVLLLVTGMIQMGGDAHYEGFLQINTPWSIGLLAKHIVIGVIIVLGVIIQWGVHPALARAQLTAQQSEEETQLRRRLQRLSAANLVLGIIVLLLTAYITAL